MVANSLLIHPLPDPWGWGRKVKIQLFQNMVMLHIKLKAMRNAATAAGTYSVLRHILLPWD